jgi:integrase
MASLVDKKDSPFWYMKLRKNGKWELKKLRERKDKKGTKRAQAMLATQNARERDEKHIDYNTGRWVEWVLAWITAHFIGASDETKRLYNRFYRVWMTFLEMKKIEYPHELTRAHVDEFIEWRTVERKRPRFTGGNHKLLASTGRRGPTISFSTVLTEIRFFSQVMKEATARGYAPRNVMSQLGLRKPKPVPKALWTDHEINVVNSVLANRGLYGWMHVTFLMCLHQGMRFSEAEMPLSCIDFDAGPINPLTGEPIGMINYPNVKASKGGATTFSQPIMPRFLEMLRAIVRHRKMLGETMLCVKPPRKKLPNMDFTNLFVELGLPHLCFHGLRATFITRIHQERIFSEAAVMKLVNHSDTMVHRLYDKVTIGDLVPQLTQLDLYRGLETPREIEATVYNVPALSNVQTQTDTLAPSNGKPSSVIPASPRQVRSNSRKRRPQKVG